MPQVSSEAIVILDFGSQFTRLIARRIREANVYCEIMPPDTAWEKIQALNPRGIILSGGPASVYEPGAPQMPDYVLTSGLPVLGICYGMGLLARALGGDVTRAQMREYGHAVVDVDPATRLFGDLPVQMPVWMSHGDHIASVPPGFAVTSVASSFTRKSSTPATARKFYDTFCLKFAIAKATGRPTLLFIPLSI
jgi:GMP synthase (glutamine-hydrolysing)